MFKNKKGNIVDIPQIAALLLIFGMCLLIGHYMTQSFYDVSNETGILDASIFQKGLDAYSLLDVATGIFLVAAIIGVAIAAFFIKTHPVWFVYAFIFLALAIFVTAILSLVYGQIESTAPLNESAAAFPQTSYVMKHLPKLLMIGAVVIAVLMYSKIDEYIGGGRNVST